MGVVGGSILAERQAEEAGDAARTQANAAREAARLVQQRFEQSREDLSPFRESATSFALPEIMRDLQAGTPDRAAQLQSNPIFQAALAARDRATLGAAATQGRIGTGDTSMQFDENFLLSALPLIDMQVRDEQIRSQNLFNLLSSGQASAAMTGQQGLQAAQVQGDLGTDAAQAIAAGRIAANQARSQPIQDLQSNLTSVLGLGF